MSHKGKWEYFKAVYERYRRAGREQKRVILDEFCLNTGYHRKYAIRLLNGPPPEKVPRQPRRRRLIYSRQAISILMAVWEAAGYPWSVKLKALLPLWMPWIRRRFRLSERLERQESFQLYLRAQSYTSRPLEASCVSSHLLCN